MRINQFIAHAGICARRAADNLIKEGKIKVNGDVLKDLGYYVQSGDVVHYEGRLLREEKRYYILLNKPKGCVTTLRDPQGRPTVMQFLALPHQVRVYPVGRLDYLTTGLLLLTNDGALAHELAHPSQEVIKMYQVTLDQPLSRADKEGICKGVLLEDGVVLVDGLKMIGKRSLRITIHMGRNRIIRRLFNHLGYGVIGLSRIQYADLTLQGVPEGKWRFLTMEEIKSLKNIVGNGAKKSI